MYVARKKSTPSKQDSTYDSIDLAKKAIDQSLIG